MSLQISELETVLRRRWWSSGLFCRLSSVGIHGSLKNKFAPKLRSAAAAAPLLPKTICGVQVYVAHTHLSLPVIASSQFQRHISF